MGSRLEQSLKKMYAVCNDPKTELQNPPVLDGRGLSLRFGWEPHGWLHYCTFQYLEDVLRQTDGDILEIGALDGAFTCVLCEFAKTSGKYVHVIDPWNGEQQGDESKYNGFLQCCQEYIDDGRLFVHRMPSQSEEAREVVRGLSLCFAWVDGLHEYGACSQDITMAKTGFRGPGIIGVDDVRGPFHYQPRLWRAAQEAVDPTWRHVVSPNSFVYTYLVRAK